MAGEGVAERMNVGGARSGRAPSLGIIFGIVLIDLLGFGLVIPQLGIYGIRFHASPFMVGLLLTVYSLMQLLFAPVLGGLSDRVGRRPVLLVSLAGSLAGYLLFAFSRSLPVLFLSRVVDGISGGNISTAQAYISDITTPENRAKGMGMIGAAFGLGFILGPGVGGLLGAWGGNLAIGLAAAALCAANLVLAFFRLPESRSPGAPVSKVGQKSIAAMGEVMHGGAVTSLLIITLLFVTAFSQMEGTFSVFLLIRHVAGGAVQLSRSLFTVHADVAGPAMASAQLKTGAILAMVGVVSSIVQGGLIGRLRKRFGERKLVIAGTVLTAVGMALIPAAPSFAALFGPMGLVALGSGLFNPSISSLVSLRADPERQGAAMGAFQAMSSLGRILGPAIGGLLFTVQGPSAPYAGAAVVIGAAVFLAVGLRAAPPPR